MSAPVAHPGPPTPWAFLRRAARLCWRLRLSVARGWTLLMVGVVIISSPFAEVLKGLEELGEQVRIAVDESLELTWEQAAPLLPEATILWCEDDRSEGGCALGAGGDRATLSISGPGVRELSPEDRATLVADLRSAVDSSDSRSAYVALADDIALRQPDALLPAWSVVRKSYEGWYTTVAEASPQLAKARHAFWAVYLLELRSEAIFALLFIPIGACLVGTAGIAAARRTLVWERAAPTEFTAFSVPQVIRMYGLIVFALLASFPWLMLGEAFDVWSKDWPMLWLLPYYLVVIAVLYFAPWFIVLRQQRLWPAVRNAIALTRGRRLCIGLETLLSVLWTTLLLAPALLPWLFSDWLASAAPAPVTIFADIAQLVAVVVWISMVSPFAFHLPFVYWTQRFEQLLREQPACAAVQPPSALDRLWRRMRGRSAGSEAAGR